MTERNKNLHKLININTPPTKKPKQNKKRKNMELVIFPVKLFQVHTTEVCLKRRLRWSLIQRKFLMNQSCKSHNLYQGDIEHTTSQVQISMTTIHTHFFHPFFLRVPHLFSLVSPTDLSYSKLQLQVVEKKKAIN